jgi:hypothetical protein
MTILFVPRQAQPHIYISLTSLCTNVVLPTCPAPWLVVRGRYQSVYGLKVLQDLGIAPDQGVSLSSVLRVASGVEEVRDCHGWWCMCL